LKFNHFARNFTAGFAAIAVLLTFALPAGAQVAVTINGNEVNFSPPSIVQAGRVFVPLRGVFERLGASVVYSNGTINATGNGHDVTLQIGSTQATVNGQQETIDVAPFIVGASTFVPLRFISQALGATVNYDGTNRVVAISTGYGGEPQQQTSYDQQQPSADYVSYGPPPIPSYEQPPVEEPNEIWQPGYWASGQYGYYWVPGTWVQPPQPNYQWTPGYWSQGGGNGGGFHFNQGFWGLLIGFYGGINYGHGYNGNGYTGGDWQNGAYRYNTAVTHVNTTNITNIYENKTVIVNNTAPGGPSYNGTGGIEARPTAEQLEAAKATHLGLTPIQKAHIETAGQDRQLLATVNKTPPVLAVVKPLDVKNRPEGFTPVTTAETPHPEAKEPLHTAAPAMMHSEAPAMVHTETPAMVHTEAPAMVHTEAPVVHPDTPVKPEATPVHTEVPMMRHTAPPVVHTVVPAMHTPVPAIHTPKPVVHTPMPAMHTPLPHVVHHTPVPTHAPVKMVPKPEEHPTPHATE
jgi:hypothetical protein